MTNAPRTDGRPLKAVPVALRIKAQLIPDRLAHDDTRRTLTIAQWDRAADDVAGGLIEAGLKPGERVLLPISNLNAVEMAIAVIAVMRTGAIGVPTNTRLSEAELSDWAALVEPRFAITNVPEKLEGLKLERIWRAEDMPHAPRRCSAWTTWP
jgi:non-ribosomal peptide synthetase component E (peptide arylation enzyme)